MKKGLLTGLALILGGVLSGCNFFQIMDGDGMEKPEGGGEWISVVTDMCKEQGGEIQQWNEGGDIQDICFFPDETFCYLEDLAAGTCEKGDIKYEDDIVEELARCDTEGENIVCGKDGNTYYNRCYLDFAGVEEETELAEVVDGECVFG